MEIDLTSPYTIVLRKIDLQLISIFEDNIFYFLDKPTWMLSF